MEFLELVAEAGFHRRVDRSVEISADDLLPFRGVEILKVCRGLFAGAVTLRVGVDDGDRRFGQDASGWRHDFVVVAVEFLHQQGLVLPGDGDISEFAFGEGDRRCTGPGGKAVPEGIPVDPANKFTDLPLVAGKLFVGVGPCSQIVPAGTTPGLGVRGDDGDIPAREIVPVPDVLGIPLADQKNNRRGVG